MALTEFQREVCRLLARNRIAGGEAYFAGGATLNELIEASRVSRDVDLFHDTEEALAATWAADRALLEMGRFTVEVVRERPAFVEAQIAREGETLLLQWARDSAYRFFPLMEHEEFGLVLHRFDLATNKVLALIGRLEVRDWIDVINSDAVIQPLGYLAWAACGKDPGFSPAAILEQAGRSSHYSADEVLELSFSGDAPDPEKLSRTWHEALDAAKQVIALLPPNELGKCVLTANGELYRGDVSGLQSSLERDEVVFHAGSIRGAFPEIRRPR
jgi:hypothetical protein